MDAIKAVVRDALAEFLELPDREYYARDHAELLEALTSEQWVGGNDWKPAIEVFDDYGLVEAMGQFRDELAAWNEDVNAIRAEWLFGHLAVELPDDHLAVFGYTSDVARRLEPLRNRCRRIVRRIDEKRPATKGDGIPPEKRTRRMSKEEALKYMGDRVPQKYRPLGKNAVRWLNAEIGDGYIQFEQARNEDGKPLRVGGYYSIDDFPPEVRDRLQ